jgi:hypothetical protein
MLDSSHAQSRRTGSPSTRAFATIRSFSIGSTDKALFITIRSSRPANRSSSPPFRPPFLGRNLLFQLMILSVSCQLFRKRSRGIDTSGQLSQLEDILFILLDQFLCLFSSKRLSRRGRGDLMFGNRWEDGRSRSKGCPGCRRVLGRCTGRIRGYSISSLSAF